MASSGSTGTASGQSNLHEQDLAKLVCIPVLFSHLSYFNSTVPYFHGLTLIEVYN